MKHKAKRIVRILVFLLILGICVSGVQHVFGIGDYSIYSREQGFAQEKNGILDGVYVGASHVFSFFQPPLAWKDHGIAVFDYAIPSMPAQEVIFRVKEARKTQPDALYIINLNCFKKMSINTQALHRSLDYMPWSMNKLQMAEALIDEAGFSGIDRLEYYLPLIRFHAGWSELESYDFTHSVNGLKGAYTYAQFLKTSQDQTENYQINEESGEISEDRERVLKELLDYLEEEKVRVLFVTAPQMLKSKIQVQINTAEEIIRERGFDCLDLIGAKDEYGLQLTTDYHDENHTNIHGSIKYTEYLCQYLLANYDFTDKRGQKGYESWDRSVDLYSDYIDKWTLDLERDHRERDYSLAAPILNTVKAVDGSAAVSWNASDGAGEYLIYRKTGKEDDNRWRNIAAVEGNILEYTDPGLETGVEYTYTVVPCRKDGEKILYGQFSFAGVSLTA